MTEIEKRACAALNEAFCRVRYFSMRNLNEQGRKHLFQVADAAHNIPDALSGHVFHRENLEEDVERLEGLLAESYAEAYHKYVENRTTKTPWFGRLRLAVLG